MYFCFSTSFAIKLNSLLTLVAPTAVYTQKSGESEKCRKSKSCYSGMLNQE